ncbi:flavin reductase family protein [Clostridium sp. YIM B02506]|uniref:flavin reductase family protein n=1 Tax=Clostridium sp. YIM B02506 TaxID=2910680 RepID=UPI001EEE0924|nr:flavin reductase family protein [Clostridium sp. YIM B02506]
MKLSAFNYGANAVCFIKNEKKYGMICAWAMQADYDKILLMLGAQSITGKNIAKGDIIGVNSLNEHQQNVVDALGFSHSDNNDKFTNIKYTINDSAILIDGASNEMIIEVTDVLHLEGIEEDYLVYGVVKSVESNEVKKYTL